MSDLKKCKSCEKEVAKSAKVCPHCGKKLKMGMFLKLIIGIVVIVVVVIVAQPSSEDAAKSLSETLDSIESETSVNLDTAKLAEMWRYGSKNTDLQREDSEKAIKGKVVEWSVKVHEVNRSCEDTCFRIQTSGSDNMPGTFSILYPKNDAEKTKITNLTTGSMIKIKGRITGTSMRNIDIKYARLR
jgi:RNA polymerase subunit RPABC4/transcription elongation factor Spt4